jgi:type IV pilus assembly protein PilX
MDPLVLNFARRSGSSSRTRRSSPLAQRGMSLLFAMVTVVALSLAAVAMIRSVDTGTTILGNLSFKQDTLMAADEATRLAIQWLEERQKTDPDGLNVTQRDQGYWAQLVPGLDPTSTSPSAQRVAIDWSNDSCRSQRGPTPRDCLKARELSLANQNSARFLIVRLCSEAGSSTTSTNQCPRPLNAVSQVTSERGEINSQNPVRIGSSSVAEYYRIVVRAQGARNTVSTTETLVHF